MKNNKLSKIAATTWTYKGWELIDALRSIDNLGFSNVELWADNFHLDPRENGSKKVKEAKKFFNENELSPCSIHAPCKNILPQSNNYNKKREKWKNLCELTIEYAFELSVNYIILHPRTFGKVNNNNYEETKHKTVKVIKYLADKAKKTDLKIAVENQHNLRGQRLGRETEELIELVEDINQDNLGICLDTAHSVFNGFKVQEELKKVNDKLLVIHVVDTISELNMVDPHLIPGQGDIDWEKVIRTAKKTKFDGPWVLEIAGGQFPEKNLLFAKEIFNEYLILAHETS